MDQNERQRLRQLANDSIITTYGYDNAESWLAEALDKVLDELDSPPHCATCSCGVSK